MERITISRKELYILVWQEPLSRLSKKFNISDNGLRKKCMKYNIPLPPYGYWMKIRYGKKVKQIKLPKYQGESEIILHYRDKDGKYFDPELSPLQKLKIEIESNPNLILNVPNRLNKPHPLIISAKKQLNIKNTHGWQYPGLIETPHGELSIKVTKNNISRALRFMDTFLKLLIHRNHEINVDYGRVRVIINTIDFEFQLKEKYKQVPTEDKWVSYKYTPTNLLSLRCLDYYGKEWNDGKKPLEERLSTILAWLEIKANEKRTEREYYKAQNWIRDMKEWLREEQKARRVNEYQKFKELLKEADRWHKARIIREYANYIQKRKFEIHNDLMDWVEWAKGKADWYDPTINTKDDILGSFNELKN